MSAGGVLINDGDVLPVGTVIQFEQIGYVNSDISWFSPGRAWDSPYGYWNSNAGPEPMACNASDIVAYSGVAPLSDHLVVSANPPSTNVTHTGSAALTCDVTGRNCTINSAGTIISDFNFTNSYVKLYYRYNYLGLPGFPTGCFGTDFPMISMGSSGCVPGFFFSSCPIAVDYPLPVPNQIIPFNFSAVSSNGPPTTPVITGTGVGSPNTNYNFDVLSTDPDGDTIRYQFDWDNDGSVDELAPVFGFVNSGVSQTLSYSWPIPMTYTFKVLAEDSMGGRSGWATKTITITVPPTPPPSATLTTPNCSSIPIGGWSCNIAVSWSSTNATTPSVRQDGTQFSTNPSSSGISRTITYGTHTFTFFNSATELASSNATASCSSGSTWDGTICKADPPPPTPPSITVTASPRMIRSGQTTDVTISVNSANPLNCSLLNAKPTLITFSHNGNPIQNTYTYDTRTLTAAQIVSASCTDTVTNLTSTGEARIEVVPVIQEI